MYDICYRVRITQTGTLKWEQLNISIVNGRMKSLQKAKLCCLKRQVQCRRVKLYLKVNFL